MKKTIAFIIAVLMIVAACSCAKPVSPDITTDAGSEGTGVNPHETTEHTIKYKKGRETASGRAPATQTAGTGEMVEISKNTFSEYEMCFVEWTDGETTYQQGEIIEMPDRDLELTAVWEKGGSTMLIEDCSNNTGWWGTYAITHGSDSDGRQWNGTSGNDVLIFCNVYDTPINVSRFEKDGYLHLTLWVENADMLVTNTSSSGMFQFYDQAGDAVSWSISDVELKNGWNDIAIRMFESSGNADLTNISSFRLYQYVNGQTEIRMGAYELWMPDNSKTLNFLGGGADYLMGENREMNLTVAVGSEITLPKNLWVRDGYDFAGWTDGEKTYQEGEKYKVTKDSMSLKAKWKAKETRMLKYVYSDKTVDYDSYDGERIILPADASKPGFSFTGWEIGGREYPPGTTYIMENKNVTANAVFREISDYALLSGALGAWELNSGGSAGYVPSATGGADLESKWTVWLNSDTFGRVADFSTSGSYLRAMQSGIDLGSSFTVSAWVNAPVREKQDRVIVSQSGGKTDKSTDELRLFSADDNTGWWGMGPINIGSETKPKEGKAYLEAAGNDLIVFCCTPEVDLSKYVDNNGSLRLWIYVDNAACLDTARGGAINLSSDGGQGTQSATWNVTDLKTGWNEVVIPLSDAQVTAGNPVKPNAINYFRYYQYLVDETVLGVDAMYIFSESVSTEGGWSLYADGKTGQLGFEMDGLSGIQLSGKNIVDGKWHQVGVTLENGTLTYYVDKEAVKTLTVKGTPRKSSDDIYIGNSPDGSRTFDGSVAQVRIFDGARSADQVTTTVIKDSDNAKRSPVLNVSKGIVMERFQGANLSRNSYEVYNPNREIHGVTPSNITASKKLGFDHVKITVTPNNMIDSEGHLIKENAIYMTEDVDAILKEGLPVLICFHPEPDYKNVYLGNLSNFELLCNWYREVAAYIGAHWSEDRVMIQLMTEPYGNSSSVSWTWMSDRMYGAVRNELPNHTIITSSDSSGNIEYLKMMSPVTDSNVIYSFTTYEPYTIGFNAAQSGMGGTKNFDAYLVGLPYPVPSGLSKSQIDQMTDEICANVPKDMLSNAKRTVKAYLSGEYDTNTFYKNNYDNRYEAGWNMLRMNSLKEWSDRYGGNIHMMCVEFGCMDATTARKYFGAQSYAGVSDETRIQHIKDLREAFEANGIGWDYWYFDGVFTVFKPETRVMHAITDDAYIRENYDADLIEKALGLKPDYSWK